jgi:ring-1,2-phenylacetyl-CoA epoxidase subunit PaaC
MNQDLSPALALALAQMLLGMADDELILAHRNSEWTGHAPILEEDIAFSNIAQDELGHALIWYGLLGDLNGQDADQLAFFREAAAYRNIQMVELPKGDWAFSMTRQYLFDALELTRTERLLATSYRPLAEAAAKIRPEELYHYRHSSGWLKRLALGTEESHRRTQQAVDLLWPYTTQFFEPESGAELLVEGGIIPSPATLREAWQEVVLPFLGEASLVIPPDGPAIDAPREAHTTHLVDLLADMQSVARLDREAKW